MPKKRTNTEVLRRKVLKDYDVEKGKLSRKYSLFLTERLQKSLPKESVNQFEDLICITQAMQSGPFSRMTAGIIVEVAFQDLLTNLSPKKLKRKVWKERSETVLRVDELKSTGGEISTYDLVINFSLWNRVQKLKSLAIDFLMATNRFESIEEAYSVYSEMINNNMPYFPIQVKKNHGSSEDLMSMGGLTISHLVNTINKAQFSTDEIVDASKCTLNKHFSKGKQLLNIHPRVSGLFFNTFTPKKSKKTFIEIYPMPDENDFDETFNWKYDVEIIEQNGDIRVSNIHNSIPNFWLKVLPSRNNIIDVGILIGKIKTRYYVSNRAEKNNTCPFFINHELEEDSITDKIFIYSAAKEIIKK